MTLSRRQVLAAAPATAFSARRVWGANDRIRVAMIGCGERNLLKEVLQFTGDTNSEVAAVCDTWKPQRDKAVAQVKAAGQREPETFVRWQDALAMKDVDAVVIGTPDHQHATQLAAAARAGKDAYIEKPIAMDMKELTAAVDAVKARNRVVQCGTQVRSFPTSKAGREFVQSGGLGRIFKIEQARNSYKPYWHRYGERKVEAADVDWKGFLMQRKARPFDADQYAAWYGYREFSRGPHANLMVHFIDLVHYVTGAGIPQRVVTLGGTYRWKDSRTAPDSIETVLEYGEGFLVRYCSTFGTSANSSLKFIGTRGVMDANKWGSPWLVSGEGALDADRIVEPRALAPVESTPHMKNFLECVRSRQAPNAPIEAGYAHAVAVIMSDEALVRGARMAYNPAKRSIAAG